MRRERPNSFRRWRRPGSRSDETLNESAFNVPALLPEVLTLARLAESGLREAQARLSVHGQIELMQGNILSQLCRARWRA